MKRTLLLIALVLLVPTLLACGGGGGGGGLSLVPAEPPPPGSGDPVPDPPAIVLASGADLLTAGQLQTAISRFLEVLASPQATPTEKTEARTGLGLSYLRSGSLLDAIRELDAVRSASPASGVALATARLARSGVADLNLATDAARDAVAAESDFRSGVVPTGVTEAQARAYAALLLHMKGETVAAGAQETLARPLAASDAAAARILAAFDLLAP